MIDHLFNRVPASDLTPMVLMLVCSAVLAGLFLVGLWIWVRRDEARMLAGMQARRQARMAADVTADQHAVGPRVMHEPGFGPYWAGRDQHGRWIEGQNLAAWHRKAGAI